MKPFRRDVAIVLIANLLSKPLWLIADNMAQNRIGHEAYGLIGALLGLGQWAIAVADWGLYALVTREMARSITSYGTTGSLTFTLKLILTLLAGVGFAVLGWLLGYRGQAFMWLLALLAYQLALSYLQYFRAFFQGNQQFRIDALLSAAEKVIVLILLAAFWSRLEGSTYVGILLTAGVVTAVGTGIGVWRGYGALRLQLRPAALWAIFRQMTPFALMGYVTAFNERLNQILLERWVGAYANGLYWGAYRWFSAAMMYLWIVLPVFFARFAKLGKVRGSELWRTFVWGQLLAALPLIGVAGIFLGAPRVFLILFTHSSPTEIAQMATILQVLALPLIVNAITAIYSTYLTAVGYEWIAFWLMVGASGVNFLACLPLVPTLKGVGAAFALGASYLFFGIGFVWAFRKKAPVPTPTSVLLRLGGLALLYGGSLFCIGQVGQIELTLGTAPVIFLALVWLLGIHKQWKYANRY
ncbi:MAG: oligosaccharide flippase family protein [Bacteroidia bacterium]|nr:oligosaccharide flippase family protein [Bacteroidia bacterium]